MLFERLKELMSPVSLVHTVETVRLFLKHLTLKWCSFSLFNWDEGKTKPDRNTNLYPHKWRAELRRLGSCSSFSIRYILRVKGFTILAAVQSFNTLYLCHKMNN